jgi:hypothetical protein
MAFRGLGDLPRDISRERGEYPLTPPISRPGPAGANIPPAGAFAPMPNGAMQQTGANQSNWQFLNFEAGLSVIKIQDYLLRKFLLIQNRSTTGTIYVGFGWAPTPLNGLVLHAGVSYEPYTYPTNEIYVLGSVAGVSGLLIFGS